MRLITTDRAAKYFAGQGMTRSDIIPVHRREKSSARQAGPATIAQNVSDLSFLFQN